MIERNRKFCKLKPLASGPTNLAAKLTSKEHFSEQKIKEARHTHTHSVKEKSYFLLLLEKKRERKRKTQENLLIRGF